ATYRTNQATYVAFRPGPHTVSAFRITATSPPTIDTGWGANQNGGSSPFVTSTDGINDMIVWVVGGDDQRLHGYDGDTGAVVYAGGGANELMTGTRKWNSGTVARGSIYVANDNKVYAFRVAGRCAYTYADSNCKRRLLLQPRQRHLLLRPVP